MGCSILDIDIDYFNLVDGPASHLRKMLKWARRPVSIVVDRHNHAFTRWKKMHRAGSIPSPSHILHVDEHHDMMDERRQTNIANFMFHAMRIWPDCRVHWLVKDAIDSPADWLDVGTWRAFRRRFTSGRHRPRNWPRPAIVSVCTSPGFVDDTLRAQLLSVVQEFMKPNGWQSRYLSIPPHPNPTFRVSAR
jgi:hypothetical protein